MVWQDPADVPPFAAAIHVPADVPGTPALEDAVLAAVLELGFAAAYVIVSDDPHPNGGRLVTVAAE
jgi:hypothetical protein